MIGAYTFFNILAGVFSGCDLRDLHSSDSSLSEQRQHKISNKQIRKYTVYHPTSEQQPKDQTSEQQPKDQTSEQQYTVRSESIPVCLDPTNKSPIWVLFCMVQIRFYCMDPTKNCPIPILFVWIHPKKDLNPELFVRITSKMVGNILFLSGSICTNGQDPQHSVNHEPETAGSLCNTLKENK